MIVTLTINPAVDRTLSVPVFAGGGVNRVMHVNEQAAGKGVNVTKALLNNGHASVAVAPVGGVTGQQLVQLSQGFPLEKIAIREQTRVNTTIVSDSGTTKLNELGPRLTEDELQNVYTTLHRVINENQADTLAVCGALNPGLGPFFFEQIRRIAVSENIKLAVDTSGLALKAAIEYGGLAVAKPNVHELEDYTETKLETLGDVIEAAWELLRFDNERMLVSLGSQGEILVDQDRAWYAASPKVSVVSTVGAGDSALAGYLSAMHKKPELALARSVAWGASAVQQHGSSVAEPKTIAEHNVAVTNNPPMSLIMKEDS